MMEGSSDTGNSSLKFVFTYSSYAESNNSS